MKLHRAILLLVLMVCFFSVSGQDYLITTRGDSIVGDMKLYTQGPEKKVLINQNKKKTYYPLTQTKRFRYKDEIYVPAKGPTGYTFMKLIKEGYVSMLAYQLENQVLYEGLYLMKKDGTGTEVPNLGFKKAMKKFLTECPSVNQKLENDEFGRRDLDAMLAEYNACITGNSVNHTRVIAQKQEQTKKISPWDALKDKVTSTADFNGKADALEMIDEIRAKISRSEKVPNFMIEGLKNSLRDVQVQEELDAALKEIQ
jgi:hypothetical protein